MSGQLTVLLVLGYRDMKTDSGLVKLKVFYENSIVGCGMI